MRTEQESLLLVLYRILFPGCKELVCSEIKK